jgi:glycosyltransferase involved in cell wall biosynthesis
MVRLCTGYAIGLAVEPDSSPNNSIALSNKIFTYLLAGLPVLLSRTPAQEQLARSLGDAAILVDLRRPQAAAESLESFLNSESAQRRARATAWRLGHEKFNWDVEKQKFLQLVRQAIRES